MFNKLLLSITLAFCFLFSVPAFAQTIAIEGKKAEALLKELQKSSNILIQENKVFILQTPDGKREEGAKEVTIEVGEYIFITNEEQRVVHNVYDQTDHSWVLKKQLPTGVAAIQFNKVKAHKLRCAIHPKMKIIVNVVEKGQKDVGK